MYNELNKLEKKIKWTGRQQKYEKKMRLVLLHLSK